MLPSITSVLSPSQTLIQRYPTSQLSQTSKFLTDFFAYETVFKNHNTCYKPQVHSGHCSTIYIRICYICILFSPGTDLQGNKSPFPATKDFISIISNVVDCTICREYSPIYREEIDRCHADRFREQERTIRNGGSNRAIVSHFTSNNCDVFVSFSRVSKMLTTHSLIGIYILTSQQNQMTE